jgi:hypothetical protein
MTRRRKVLLICGWCSEQVIPTKEIDWIIFIVLLLFGILGGILYLIYWAGKPGEKCPLCKGDIYGRLDTQMEGGIQVVVAEGRYYSMDSPDLREVLEAEAKKRVALARRGRRRIP